MAKTVLPQSQAGVRHKDRLEPLVENRLESLSYTLAECAAGAYRSQQATDGRDGSPPIGGRCPQDKGGKQETIYIFCLHLESWKQSKYVADFFRHVSPNDDLPTPLSPFPFPIHHSSFCILLSPFPILHSSFCIPHSSFSSFPTNSMNTRFPSRRAPGVRRRWSSSRHSSRPSAVRRAICAP